jgi:hypothetical protein
LGIRDTTENARKYFPPFIRESINTRKHQKRKTGGQNRVCLGLGTSGRGEDVGRR